MLSVAQQLPANGVHIHTTSLMAFHQRLGPAASVQTGGATPPLLLLRRPQQQHQQKQQQQQQQQQHLLLLLHCALLQHLLSICHPKRKKTTLLVAVF